MPNAIGWLDSVLVLALLLGMAVGYVQGILRQVVGLASMYMGAIMAAMYTYWLSATLRQLAPTTPGTLLNMAAFFIIFAAVMALINFLAADAYRLTQLRLPLGLNHLGGMVVGIVGTWILVTITLDLLEFAAAVPNWAAADDLRQQLVRALNASQLVEATRITMPAILAAIRPWLPAGFPSIFHL